MINKILKRTEIENSYKNMSKWKKIIFQEFIKTMLNAERPFPCIFGVNGIKDNEVRFLFLETITAESLANPLAKYLTESRKYGQNTSLIVFEKPTPVESLSFYKERFWSLLNDLVKIDHREWPDNIPQNLADPYWEFCFNGEPIFVVCNTPAHTFRLSRKSTAFMLTLQPRWVFDDILGTEDKARKSFNVVTKRLEPYDFIDKSKDLGKYGDHDNLEWKQYFLEDQNDIETKCPFSKLGE